MLNRILIRIKTVQMLYAYLLARTPFKVEADPDLSSADKKFAHKAYLEILSLIVDIADSKITESGQKSEKSGARRLFESAIGRELSLDTTLHSYKAKDATDSEKVANLAVSLRKKIIETSVYKEFCRKRKAELSDEAQLWSVLLETVIAKDAETEEFLRTLPGYSKLGYELAIQKTLATLQSSYGARASYYEAKRNLEESLYQSHVLYMSIFGLIVRLTQARDLQIDNARNKYLATAEDLNPNTKFVDNLFAHALAQNVELNKCLKDNHIDWIDDPQLLDSLLEAIMNSTTYKEYMESEDSGWEADCEFWRQILKNVVFLSDELEEALESKSVYWNDDLHIVGTFALKSIRTDSKNTPGIIEFLPQYKDEEDSRFGAELFELAVKNRDEYLSYIHRFVHTAHWDSERIAFMDNVIMLCAIAEIVNFPNIPLAVSLNEYIDIANIYSTAKSGQFINGLLYSIVEHLKQENIIFK